MPPSLVRRAALAATAACALLATPALAAPVTSGQLSWSTQKIYDMGAPAGTDRTWLGYVTSPFPLANGTATPSDGASGDTVTNASATGAYGFAFPAASGTYEPATGSGEIQLDGVVTFFSPPGGAPPNGGHDFTLSIADPRLVLDGDHGRLFASGLGSAGPYAQAPAFDLDLSGAIVTLHADGSRTIAGIVPSVAINDVIFPAPYVAGSGPDRTPNTFGSFSLRVRVAPTPPGSGPQGPAGPQGPIGKPGKTARLQTAVLRRAPYPDGKRHAVTMRAAKAGRVLAKGTVRGRTITVKLTAAARTWLRGAYLVRIGDQPAVKVRVL